MTAEDSGEYELRVVSRAETVYLRLGSFSAVRTDNQGK
jgi:hypothetical protein